MNLLASTGLVVALLAASWPACPQAAIAQASESDVSRAKQLFQAGVADYDAGRYAEAVERFQEAYRIKPHPLVRVNIANCYQRLDRPVEAIENFEAFLSMTEGTPTQREEVRAALKELRDKVGHIVLKVSPAGARIVIDDHDERHAPVSDPVLATVGRHRITASLDGYETALRVVDVRAHESATLQIALASVPASEVEASAAAPAPPPPEATELSSADAGMAGLQLSPEVELVQPAPAPSPPTQRRRLGLPLTVWIAGGTTVALLVSAIVTGQLALAANHEFDGNLAAVRNPQLSEYQRAGAWARGLDASRRADTLAAATDLLLGLSLAGAGLTTFFVLADRSDRNSQSPRLSARLGVGRVQLHGQF